MITGIFAPIPTPFKNGVIDYDSLKKNLEKWGKTPLSGVVVLGSNGEFAYLRHQEKIELVAFVRENLPTDKKVIAGTGCETTEETIILPFYDSGADIDYATIDTICVPEPATLCLLAFGGLALLKKK